MQITLRPTKCFEEKVETKFNGVVAYMHAGNSAHVPVLARFAELDNLYVCFFLLMHPAHVQIHSYLKLPFIFKLALLQEFDRFINSRGIKMHFQPMAKFKAMRNRRD